MTMYVADTIAAISTPHGEGGIGIVRVSGSQAREIGLNLFRFRKGTDFSSHYLHYGSVVEPLSGAVLDEVMAVMMLAPRSYTCEDVLEIHCHGGLLVVDKVLTAVLQCGARLADPGEFTRRAFLNGRIDLLQAEAVMDVIASRSEMSLTLARQQQEGALSRRIVEISTMLLHALALIEAYIDFPEDDLGHNDIVSIRERVQNANEAISALLSGFDEGRVIRDGVAVLIVGKPNVGKSSLLNCLLGEQRAIVTHIAGTTRDIIEETAIINGLAVRLLDTAGIRHTEDLIEKEGIHRALECVPLADLVLFVLDASRPFDAEDLFILDALKGKRILVECSKSDLSPMIELPENVTQLPRCSVSVTNGYGIDELRLSIRTSFMSEIKQDSRQLVAISRLRHRETLTSAQSSLQHFLEIIDAGGDLEVLAIEVRNALESVGQVTGGTTPDEILDLIFSSFCIGK